MAQAAKSQEPSMEEILASIRRIIAEDDADKSAQPARPSRRDLSEPPTLLRPWRTWRGMTERHILRQAK